MDSRNRQFLDISCGICKQRFRRGEAMQIYKDVHYHPECFRCRSCNKSLAGLAFYPKGDNLFMCEQCNDATSPVCAVCGQKIQAGLRAKCYNGLRFHSQCFTCDRCEAVINDGMRFVDLGQNRFQCLNCSHHMSMGHSGREHAPPEIENFLGQKIVITADDTGRVPICDKCAKPVLNGTPAFQHQERHYHPECSTCKSTGIHAASFATDFYIIFFKLTVELMNFSTNLRLSLKVPINQHFFTMPVFFIIFVVYTLQTFTPLLWITQRASWCNRPEYGCSLPAR
ncbi:hypothetical protein ACOME3_000276 [Neoechinorhynchus agilis]